jgi:hypothetical protein
VGSPSPKDSPQISNIDNYKLLMIATLAVLPLLLMFKPSRRPPPGHSGTPAAAH